MQRLRVVRLSSSWASSVQEKWAEVGSVNRNVAPRAFTFRCKTQTAVRNIRSLRIDVTLQAQEAPFTPKQELPVHCAMWTVTARASLHLDCSVFIHKRASFLRMAIDASFPCCFSQHRLIVRAMRVVAIRAFHESFWNPVMRRQR